MNVRFLLVSEGTSDEGLLPHLEELCVRLGANEATGIAPDLARLPRPPGRRMQDRLAAAVALEPQADLLFVHRDANTAGTAARRQEIEKAAAPTGLPVVPVIPVRALEAWLLLDEQSIREVAGNPRGTVPLGLPEPRRVERVVKPKALLREVIATASEASGRRLARLHRSFPQARAQRLSRLSLDGPVAGVPGWQVLVHDTREAIEALRRGMVRPQEP